MKDREIDLSDLPEIAPERFARAIVRKGLQPVAPKAQITLRIDAEVLQWFRSRGAGYQSRMNAVLRAYWALCAAGEIREPAPPARRDESVEPLSELPKKKRRK
jgi:uncharacterized protein (DUF4415 family)